MKTECFNEHSYVIGTKPAPFEGFGLKAEGGEFVWYYTERGRTDVLKKFTDEREACQYAFKQMKNDKFARSHLVGFLESEELKNDLCTELKERNIEFMTDKIPFEQGSCRHRVFVFGCDRKNAEDLKDKYRKLEPKALWRNKKT